LRIEIGRSKNVLQIYLDNIREGWEQWFLLSSDRHHDSIYSDRELALEHMEKVKEKDAYVFDFGDFFDVMQGKYDPRKNYPEMKPEYVRIMKEEDRGYFDIVVQDAVDFYSPYAERFLLISRGNHETSVLNHNEIDLIGNLVFGLNTRNKTNIHAGFYGGYVRFMFTMQGTTKESMNMKYFHGSGGNAPVTRNVIQTARQAIYLPDANIVVNGHVHENWIVPIRRERINRGGRVFQDTQWHIRTGTYADTWEDGSGGWNVERGSGPRPKGAIWAHLYYDNRHVRVQFTQELAP
jgi:hypothetical protein